MLLISMINSENILIILYIPSVSHTSWFLLDIKYVLPFSALEQVIYITILQAQKPG